jgi:dephospho-CoA kinase
MVSGTKPKPSATKASPVWGLTGGIASGKSSVAKFFAEAGFTIIDADQISRELSAPGGAAFAAIVERLGTGDRAELRKIVFDDPKARKELEAILHPLIGQESRRRMAASKGPVIYEATLLVEAGRKKDFAGLIVVEAPLVQRISRLRARDGIDESAAKKILAAQLTDAERRAHADHVIVNDDSLEELRTKTLALAHALQSLRPTLP